MNRRPKAVLLDYYGTAVRDDLSLVNRVACQIADAAETETTAHQVSTHWQDAVRVLRRRACGDTYVTRAEIDRRAIERTLARFGARLNAEVLAAELDESRRRARPFDETVSVLSLCPVPVVVLANGDRDTLEENLRSTGLAFHDVITSEDVRAYKPRAVIWLKALGRLRLSPDEVLHVGDSLQTDIRGARELGIPTLWINRKGLTMVPRGLTPDHQAPDLKGLLPLVLPGRQSADAASRDDESDHPMRYARVC